ncbi:MAG TPA: ABC transporter permease [Gaiellaceae bacterium]|jgi:peptide/nickel transport system permease protein
MGSYVLKRVAVSIALLIISSILIFCLMRVIPGDPTITKVAGASGNAASVRALRAVRHELGLDQSLPAQYVHWVGGILRGDFGESYYSQFPVTKLISQRIGATLELAVLSLIIGVLMAVPAAVISAIWRNRAFDALLSAFTAIGMATPAFVTGIVLIVVFGVKLNLLPTQGYVSITHHPIESLKTAVLPSITLAIAIAAPLLRILDASLDDVASAPYIRTAAGKGLLRRQVVMRHLLPNATIPALTMLGVIIGSLLGGTVIVEYVFARPGLGTLVVDSVFKRDYAVLQTLVLLAAATFILSSLAIDLLYGVIDPRLRVRGSEAAR